MSILSSLEKPIIQAPIGSAASLELAAAVSNAGGMSTLAMTWTSPEDAQSQVETLKAQTSGAFATNFVLSFEAVSLAAVLRAHVPVVTFSWGIRADLIEQCHAAGAEVGVQVGSVAGAVNAIAHGADFLICQGNEAGGHVQSTTSLLDLLQAVVGLGSSIPIAAAGGLADHSDVCAVLDAGASAAMFGTRFVAASESRAHPLYKQAIVDANAGATSFTWCFDGGWPYSGHRVLRNKTLNNWESEGCPLPGQRPGEDDIVATTSSAWDVPRYHMASPVNTTTGNVLEQALYAGTGSARIKSVLSTAEIIAELWPDTQKG